MTDGGKDMGMVVREGDDLASGPELCLTLEGAYHQVRTTFLRHHPNGDAALLDRAFKAGKAMHANQRRKSGEPYFFHPWPWPSRWRNGGWTR